MADLTRRIVLELLARNKATGELAAFTHGIDGVYRGVRRMATGLLALAGIYGVKQVFTSLTDAAMESESAERRMAAALRITGDATDSNVGQLKRYAEELQKLTIYGDEDILQQMSMAKSMGAGTRELDRITIAAIGLASAYDKDLGEAMRIVTLASQGQTGQLKRMGIVIDQNLSPQEKYNQLLALGAKDFDMAVAATQTASGSLKQYQNAMHGTKAAIGEALLPAMATFYQTMQTFLEQNQEDMKAWAEGTIGILTTVVNAYLKAQRKFADLTERAAAPALIEKTAFDRYLIRYPEEQKRQEELRRKTMESLARAPFGAPSMVMPRIKPAYPEAMDEIKTQLRGEQETIWNEREALQKEMAGRLTTLTGKYELPKMDLESSGQVKNWAEEAEKSTMDIAAAYARMYKDIDSKSAASFQAREQLIQNEYTEYDKVIKDKYALDMWYLDQQKKLSIERGAALGGPLEGIAAGMDEIGRKTLSVGEMFKQATETGVEGFADALSRAIVRSEDLGDALRELGLDIAQTMMKQAIITGISGGWGAIFGGGAPVAHAGGTVGQTSFPTRMVDPGIFARAPWLHNGLASDEFPAILQRGERVISRSQASGGSSSNQRLEALMGQVVSLLSQRQTINLSAKVVDSRDVVTGEQMEGRRGEKFVMRHVGRNS